MGAYLKLHAYFDSYFQSSPAVTKSLIFHWQGEATIAVKSVGKATSFFTSFLCIVLYLFICHTITIITKKGQKKKCRKK